MRSFQPNKTFIGRMCLLFTVILASSVAFGFGFGASDPGFWVAIARWTWPLSIAIFGLLLFRFGRVALSDAAVIVGDDGLTMRFEPLRLRDRTIEQTSVAHLERVGTRWEAALAITMQDGSEFKIQDRYLAEPDELARYLKAMWPDVGWLTSEV